MPPLLSSRPGRRSRDFDSDDDLEESREGTPASTAPNDSKRARRNLAQDEDSTPAHTGAQRLSNEMARTRKVTDDVSRRRPKHKPGAIVRVKLANFVTYTSAEFFPGPNLNMVIGPNGTGKSTLVCAICLGLGWGTQHLGRAKDTSEFVKNGCREATIEIELQRADTGPQQTRRNPVITRLIKREGNKSTYTLNGNSCSQKQVVELAKSFSIQIDNLCQFLPQDRVSEFAQMNPMELLHSTQRAAGGPEMLEWHENLVRLRKHQKEIMGENQSDREQLKNLQNRQDGQRHEVENTRRRAELKQRLHWLGMCRPIPQYRDSKEKATQAKEDQKRLTAELKELKREVAPALRRVNEKQHYEQEVKALKQQREKHVAAGEKNCDKLEKKIGECDDSLKELENIYGAERRGIAGKKQERLKIQRDMDKLKRQMEQVPEPFDARAINQQIQEKVDRKRELQDQANEYQQRAENIKSQGKEHQSEIETLRKRLANLETQSGQQLTKLEQRSKDTHKAWSWIQEHRDQFEQEVFGPPMVTCSLKDPRMASVVEAVFQEGDFKIITVQCKGDFTILQRTCRELKLHDVSIRVCSIESPDQFQAPMSQEQLKGLGLDAWALDCLNGPPVVLAMLCSEKFLHQTAVGERDISNQQYESIARTNMRTFVAGKTLYRVTRRAEYGDSGTSTNTRDVRPASVWTNQPVDTQVKAEIQNKINEKKDDVAQVKEALDQLKEQMREMKVEFQGIDGQIAEMKEDKDTRQQTLMAFKALPAKLTQSEEKLEAVEEHLSGVRERQERNQKQQDQVLLKKAEATIAFAAAVTELRVLNAQLLEAEVMHIEALSDFESLKERNREVNDLLQAKVREESQATEKARAAVAAAKQFVKEVRVLRAEGLRLQEEGDPTLSEVMSELAEKPNFTAEDLEVEIGAMVANLELVHGGDTNAIEEYEERERKIQKLRDRLDGSKAKALEIKDAIAEVRGNWEPRLDALVAKISDAFGESFARIGCAGSVAVFKAGSPDDAADDSQGTLNHEGTGSDFANWALHVSVKFRESEPLSLLDQHRQSGGERAVSTIFYLMALQSLSRAPFRVVDEINQGMDSRNERMVHGRMVDIAAGQGHGEDAGGSQYFLITPKLLSGLKYARGMTVLCIVSGENMPKVEGAGPEGKVDFRRFVAKARELGLAGRGGPGSAGRRVDSGVALGSSFGSHEMNGYGDGDGDGDGDGGVDGMDRGRSVSRLTSVGA